MKPTHEYINDLNREIGAARRERTDAQIQRNRWIRAFNSLDKAVSNVLDDDHPADLRYLAAAQREVMKELT